MSEICFYEIVDVLASGHTAGLGIANARGIVVGMAEEAGKKTFAVLVADRTFSVEETDLSSTGERVEREAIYGGETVRVQPEQYPEGGGEFH